MYKFLTKLRLRQHLTFFRQQTAPNGTDRRVDVQFVSFQAFFKGDKQQNTLCAGSYWCWHSVEICVLLLEQ